MADTSIEWTDKVWNPTTGCDRVSPGCDNCYALGMAKRLKGMGSAKYQKDGNPRTSGPGFGITEHSDTLMAPLGWRKPRKVFVNSMSDLFHAGVSDKFIARVWAVMAATPQHTYQVLTKRPARMRSLLLSDRFHGLPLRNVWLGVSVEDQKRADLRIPALLDTPAAVRWLSCEPLLGPVALGAYVRCRVCRTSHKFSRQPCDPHTPARFRAHRMTTGGDIDWVVAGGESGPGARPMNPDWARSLRDQCASTGVPFHMKQTGAVLAKEWGATGKGGDPAEWPEEFPREYPDARH